MAPPNEKKSRTVDQDALTGKEKVNDLHCDAADDQARAAEYKAMLDGVPAYIFWAHDPDGLLLTGNTLTYELLGLPPGSHVSLSAPADEGPRRFRAMQAGQEIPPQELPLQQAARGQVVRDYQFDLVFEDGATRSLSGNAVPLWGKDGRPRGAIGAFVDITAHRRRMEERTAELQQAIEQLQREMAICGWAQEDTRGPNEELERRAREHTARKEAANRELEAFSYSVSHDLKAPIRAIEGFSRMLATEHAAKLDAEGLRLLDIISSNAKLMGQLLDDLLAFSHLGRKQVKKSVFNLAAMTRQVFAQVRAQVPGRKLKLTVKDLPPAYGDLSMISLVLVHLLTNAIKFTKSKKAAVIEVGGWTERTENIYYVKDNGIGFDEHLAQNLFGAFQRLHRGEEYEGTGIGLAIVQLIIQRHGGRVWAEGKVDQGATFFFTLPGNQEMPGN